MAEENDAGDGAGGEGSAGAGDAGSGGNAGGAGDGGGNSDPRSSFGGGDGGGGSGDGLPPIPEWAGEVSDLELRGWLSKKTDRFPDLETALKSHRELESYRGVDETQLVKLADQDDKDAWHGAGGIYEKLGRPQNPDGYEFPQFDVQEGEMNLADAFRPLAHQEGLSKAQGEKIVGGMLEKIEEFKVLENTKFAAQQAEQQKQVSEEWGEDVNASADKRGPKMQAALAGAKAIGFDPTQPEGAKVMLELEKMLGTRVALNKMYEIGARLGEHSGGEHGAGQGDNFMTQGEAQEQLTARENNPDLQAKWLDGDPEEVELRRKLFGFANPTTTY